MVFSHGFLMDHTMFDEQVTVVAPQYRVITWDQRLTHAVPLRRRGRRLLVLDNCEHLGPAVAKLADLLRAAPICRRRTRA